MKKRILAMILCVLMIVTMLPTWAVAEEVQEETEPGEAIVEVQEAESVAIEEPVQDPIEEPEPVIQETNAEAEETPAEREETEETTEKEPSTEPAVEEPAPAELETAETEKETEVAPGVPETPSSKEETEPADEVDDGSEKELAETDVEEATQDETATDPENEEEFGVQNVDDAAEDEKVRVTFQLDPPNTTLTVYTLDENEEKQIIEPEEDGSYFAPVKGYYFDVECDGYESVRGIRIDAVKKASPIYISLVPLFGTDNFTSEISIMAVPGAKQIPILTGDQAYDTARIAESQLGYSGANGTIYGQWWNTVTNWGVDYTYSPWCAMFACWCANQAGAGLNKAYNNMCANEENLFNWLKSNASYDESFTKNPKAGDFVFFNGHVAVVTGYDSSTRKITFVGGNQGNAVTKGTVTWASDSYWGEQYVRGYGRPNYIIANTCTITFNSNGGSCSTTNMNVTKDTNVYNLPTPSLEGYSFTGWYTEPYGGTNFVSGTVVSDNITLYAHWTHEGWKMSFDPNGGNLPDDAISHQINGIDIGRSLGYLVVFKDDYQDTNHYGAEIAVDANGCITGYRPYNNTEKLIKPSGGFILSGHLNTGSDACSFVQRIYNEGYKFVGIDYGSGIVTAYKNYAAYLADTKYVKIGDSYGDLPFITKDGFVLAGWYYRSGVNSYRKQYRTTVSDYGEVGLYASWIDKNNILPDVSVTYNGHLYERYDLNTTWLQAKELCEMKGGHLVTITDSNEQAAVEELLNEMPFGIYCIGATDAENEGTWKWVTGEQFAYENWDKGAPEPNGSTEENYALIMGQDNPSFKTVGEWVDCPNTHYGDFYSTSNSGFICEYEQFSGASGSLGNLSWILDKDGLLTISGSGVMEDLEYSSTDAWRKYKDHISAVVINSGVTSVGSQAFDGCTGLTSVTIPTSVTSIGSYAFRFCSGLTSITIPSSVTSIGDGAFVRCSGLTSITIPSSVTSIGEGAFVKCSGLTSITIPSSLTSIEYDVFDNCSGLTSITIPSSVTSIGRSAFEGCDSLAKVYYGGSALEWDNITISEKNEPLTTAIISYNNPDAESISGTCGDNLTWTLSKDGVLTISGIGEMNPGGTAPWKKYREQITSVVIQSGVTSISSFAFGGRDAGGVFDGCGDLISVTLPDTLTSIGAYAFWDCGNLKNITIPSSVTTIGEWAFRECRSLTGITIPSSVTSIGECAFSGCPAMMSIDVDNANQYYCDLDGVLYNNSKTRIECFPGGRSGEFIIPSGVTEISNYAFFMCPGLTKVMIPSSVTIIGESAFEGCSKITDVTILNGVQTIEDSAFRGCTALTSLTIPSSVAIIGIDAFAWCNHLASVTIPLSVTNIYFGAFYQCSQLTDVYYEGNETEWDGINIGKDNDPLNAATIHYNSALCQHTPGAAVRENVIAASCKMEGSYDSVVYCTLCGEEIGRETKVIPKLAHSTELRNRSEATCTSAGYTGDEVCINCGDIINAGTTVAAFGHSWGEWTVTKAATCTEKGTETRTCAHNSNHKETKEIAALGHNFVNGVCTHVGCGERDPGYAVDTTGKLIVSAAKGRMGDTVTVNVSIAENPGIMVLNLGFDYDRTRLIYEGFEDAGFTDWTVASNAVWLGNSNSTFNGVILKLKFKIVDNAPEGDAYVTVTCGDGDMADQNETVYIPSIQAGKVTVFTTLPGDINGDGKVNALDLVRLKRVIAGENVELVGSGDTTGDGKVNALDLVRLKRYLAGENVELH